MKSPSSRGLAIRGHENKFGSTHSGNFVMSLELIAEFDPFLQNHIPTFGNKGKGKTSYLSFTVFEQFIEIMGEKVKKTIVNEIKNAKQEYEKPFPYEELLKENITRQMEIDAELEIKDQEECVEVQEETKNLPCQTAVR